jgi:hypothetical protein
MAKKYRKKPVVIEAIIAESAKTNPNNVILWVPNACRKGSDIYIKTLEGEMSVNEGDYVIKGVNGEFYPCKPDIFKKTYEEVI